MALNINVNVTGDSDWLKRTQAALRNPKRLMRRIGVLAMSSAVRRLETVPKKTSKEENVRSGRLAASLKVGNSGTGGTENTVFDLSDLRVEVGTNLPYAAQLHFGGIIEPVNAKALAIPLIASLARNRIGPLELDASRESLAFVPVTGKKPNVFGLLTDPENKFGFGKGEALYLLAYWVTQPARPFLLFDDDDVRTVNEDLVPQWLDGK